MSNEKLILEALAMILERQPNASLGNIQVDAGGNWTVPETPAERMVKQLREAAKEAT